MSRIGKRILKIEENVNVSFSNNVISVKGPRGTLTREIPKIIKIIINDQDKTIELKVNNKIKEERILQGTYNSHINNMLIGVVNGYEKKLKIVGVGYRAKINGEILNIKLGFSHDVNIKVLEGIKVEVSKNVDLKVSGINKEKVTAFAANIRSYKKPEPYKGKGIRYVDEHIVRKEGKTAGK